MSKCILCNKKRIKGGGPFFKVPEDQRRRADWSRVCGITFTGNNIVCVEHFAKEDLIAGSQRLHLMPNSIPTLNIKAPSTGQNDTGTGSVKKEVEKVECPGISHELVKSNNGAGNVGIEVEIDEYPAIVYECHDSDYVAGNMEAEVEKYEYPAIVYECPESDYVAGSMVVEVAKYEYPEIADERDESDNEAGHVISEVIANGSPVNTDELITDTETERKFEKHTL